VTDQLDPLRRADGIDQLRATIEGGVVQLDGEIDLATSAWLKGVLAEVDPGEPLSLDMSSVSFMDSSGIRVLLAISSERDLTIVNPSDRVHAVLQMSGLLERFHML
jgi:anti-anti-sigma factor